MSLLNIRFNSTCLRRSYRFNLILPNDPPEWFLNGNENYNRPPKTLVLLHGYSEDLCTWITDFNIVGLAYQKNIAIILPDGENSFYTDAKATGHQYATLIGKELIEYVQKTFNIAQNMKDTFIAGFSMGGYGALHLGLKFPQTFNACVGLSSAIITKGVRNMKPGDENPIANYDYYEGVFGELKNVCKTENDLEFQVKELQKNDGRIPHIFMACGTEDFLLNENRDFDSFLKAQKVNHEYFESSGNHNMQFWGEYIQKATDWMLTL